MSPLSTCPTCGSPLPDGVSERQCPACLLRAGMQAETVPSDAADHPDSMAGAETTAAPREALGTMIGRYKLLREIGEGGFGIVYLADQKEPVKRKVALKVLKPGMDTREVVARFEAERQALAMMDHPNIAQVYDGGATESGRPYFVMELVKGMPVTAFCNERRLGTRERLELFADICSAINHAHQKGIIHRDLKPSNVLVALHGATPVVKVIDFGIAKATQQSLTDMTLFTRPGDFIGTPVYMSPEQAALSGIDIDTRSDVYSLGVLLYELLTGKPPFDARTLASAGYEEMRRIIREEEPPKPSTRLAAGTDVERVSLAAARHTDPAKLSRMVRGDLDWIVMKAIEKDRTRRYETANAFAADIQRFLLNEPVLAAAPSAGYKFRKFARRNKAALAVAALIAVVLVAATGVSLWQAKLARAAAADALKAQNDATEKAAAERIAREDAEAISTFLSEVFQSPDPSRDSRTITVAETLNKAAKTLDTALASQPRHRAKLQATLGRTYHALGLFTEAIPLLEAVVNYDRSTLGPEHPDTLAAMNALAISYHASGRRDEALKLREEVLLLSRKVNGSEHPATLRAMSGLALSCFQAGRRDEALKMWEEVLPLSLKVNGPEDPQTLLAMSGMANSCFGAGRTEEALKFREDVLKLRRKVNGPEHPDTLLAMDAVALSYSDAGRGDEALKIREEVLPLRVKVNGPEYPDTLGAMTTLAISYGEAGRLPEAIALQEQSLAIVRRVLSPNQPFLAVALEHMAILYEKVDRKEEAAALRKELAEKQK